MIKIIGYVEDTDEVLDVYGLWTDSPILKRLWERNSRWISNLNFYADWEEFVGHLVYLEVPLDEDKLNWEDTTACIASSKVLIEAKLITV